MLLTDISQVVKAGLRLCEIQIEVEVPKCVTKSNMGSNKSSLVQANIIVQEIKAERGSERNVEPYICGPLRFTNSIIFR